MPPKRLQRVLDQFRRVAPSQSALILRLSDERKKVGMEDVPLGQDSEALFAETIVENELRAKEGREDPEGVDGECRRG
jgi:hypothetical protein